MAQEREKESIPMETDTDKGAHNSYPYNCGVP